MKSRISITFCFILALVCFFNTSTFAQLKGDTYASAKESKRATWILTYSDSPGLASMNGTKPEGLCYDLMTEFAKYVKDKKGIVVTFEYKTDDPNDFPKFLSVVKASKGGVFGLSNTTITEERKKSYNFSPPFLRNVSMILTNNSVPELTDIKNISTAFAQMKAVIVKGSTNEARILDIKKKYYPNMIIEYTPSFAKSIEAIATNPKIFTSADFTYYLKGLQSGKTIKRHAVGDEDGEEFGIIMPISNDWNPLLTEFMNSGFINSVQFNKIITNHLGQSVLKFTKNR